MSLGWIGVVGGAPEKIKMVSVGRSIISNPGALTNTQESTHQSSKRFGAWKISDHYLAKRTQQREHKEAMTSYHVDKKLDELTERFSEEINKVIAGFGHELEYFQDRVERLEKNHKRTQVKLGILGLLVLLSFIL